MRRIARRRAARPCRRAAPPQAPRRAAAAWRSPQRAKRSYRPDPIGAGWRRGEAMDQERVLLLREDIAVGRERGQEHAKRTMSGACRALSHPRERLPDDRAGMTGYARLEQGEHHAMAIAQQRPGELQRDAAAWGAQAKMPLRRVTQQQGERHGGGARERRCDELGRLRLTGEDEIQSCEQRPAQGPPNWRHDGETLGRVIALGEKRETAPTPPPRDPWRSRAACRAGCAAGASAMSRGAPRAARDRGCGSSP